MTSEPKADRREWWVRSRGWIAIVLLTPFAVATLLSWPFVRDHSLWHFPLEAAGWACFLVGLGFRWWATLYIGGRKQVTVVSDGPYSLCRNPLYVGTFLMTLAIAFFVPSLTFAGGVIVASLFYLSVTVSAEEKWLRHTFGDEYTRYCQEVPRFFPRIRRPRTLPVIEVFSKELKLELIRAARYVWVPLLAEGIAHLRFESWWPHMWRLP